MKRTVLLVDDNKEIAELLQVFIEKSGIRTLAAHSGTEAWIVLNKTPVDLIILDIMMPEMDGMELLHQIRKTSGIPVIFLSAKSQDEDKIAGLKLGADDFVSKPFNPVEVVARVEAILRRSYTLSDGTIPVEPGALSEETILGALRLSHRECMLYKDGKAINLTATEYRLLNVLMDSPGRVFTKKQLFEQAWSDHYYEDANTVTVHMSRLRDKLELNPRQPVYLLTVRGLGYKFAREKDIGYENGTT